MPDSTKNSGDFPGGALNDHSVLNGTFREPTVIETVGPLVE